MGRRCVFRFFGRVVALSVFVAKVGESNMDLLIGGQKGLGQSNRNLIRSRVVMFADLPGFKVNSSMDSLGMQLSRFTWRIINLILTTL